MTQPYQFCIYPHAELTIIWKENWEQAVDWVSKTCSIDQHFYLCELLTGQTKIIQIQK